MSAGPFTPLDDGSVRVELGDAERRILEDLATGMRNLLADPDAPDLRRLFPTAHPDDPGAQEEWRLLMGSELIDSRTAALEVLGATAHEEAISFEQLDTWMQALNAVRLVLGTRLDVGEEPPDLDEDDPDLGAWALYELLAWLVDGAVRVLTRQLPPTAER